VAGGSVVVPVIGNNMTRDCVIPHVVDEAVRQHGPADAIRTADGSVSYTELGERIGRVAAALLDAGVRPLDTVMLIIEQHPWAVAALLGVVKSGAIAVPVVASTPPERQAQIFDAAGPVCIVSDAIDEGAACPWPHQPIPIILVQRLGTSVRTQWPRVHVTDPAVIIYTSGSTGAPKGVVLTNQSVMHTVWATARVFEATPPDRIATFSSYAVGQGLTATMSAVVAGAAACHFDVRRFGLDRLVTWLREQRVSIFISSASLFRSLVRTADNRINCPTLRLVRLGSERITLEDVHAFRRCFGSGVALLIAYSSTETGTVAMHQVRPDESFPDGVVPVGQSIDGVTVAIVDGDGDAVPHGGVGEVVVQSSFLPAGYWRDAERTTRVYTPVPGTEGERLCRTGDLGRLSADGRLELLGRADRRVKIRGYRVELDEIERVLAEHPAVHRAAVVAPTDTHGDASIVAYLELRAASAASVDEIGAFARRYLPDHVIPSTFLVLDAMPLTDTGKVARSQLPDATRARPSMSAAYVAARTPLEQTIAGVWQEVLGLDAIGVNDPFLLIGGDSLRAGQIASRLSAIFDIDLQLWELLEVSTIAQVAERLAVRIGNQAK
jgi:amino acid adenylation domain-containing protein